MSISAAIENRPLDELAFVDSAPIPPLAAAPVPVGRLGVYAGLLVSLRAKHAPTAAHCVRVAQNLSAWGLYYRLPEEDLGLIELGGLLHDLGKVGIPERILQKPSRLLPEERSLVDIHPQIGIEILRSTGIDPLVVESLQLLGTWYDGSNRNGEPVQLPLVQRILSIADAFDAMTTEQTYRQAMSTEAAIDELQRMSGTQFDPKLVKSFIEVVQRANDNLRQAVQDRWHDVSGSNSLIYLFKNHNSAELAGSAAIQSLNGIFHQRMMDHMNDGVIFVDTELRILGWNQAAERLTGLKRSAVLHSQWLPELINLSDRRGRSLGPEQCPIRGAMTAATSSTQRLLVVQPDGTQLKIDAQLMPIFDDRNVLRGGAMLMGDASDQADLEEMVIELHTQATQDPLTKVSNRAELNRRMPEFVLESQKREGTGCVVICDIDFFKRINDTFGHAAGDEALKVFASVLQNEARETDLVARYGGEEFVILCDDCDLVSAVRLAESIRHKLQRTPIDVLKGKCLTASFGVAEVVAGDTPEAPIDRADHALLEAKQTGRDRVVSVAGGNRKGAKAVSANAASDGPARTGTSWLSWLGGGNATPLVTSDLISSVPREIVIEKLKGFISESSADVISIQNDKVHLRVDCRNAPMQRRTADRPAVFEIILVLEDIELAGAGKTKGFQLQTRIKLDILPVRQRDRRTEALVDQANRLRFSFQSFLQAELIDDGLRDRIIPVYKPGSDGR